jgi:hypothetical protein
MKLIQKWRLSQHRFHGTLQNPEAHKNGMSQEEFQAMRDRERAEAEAAAAAKAAEEAEKLRAAEKEKVEAVDEPPANVAADPQSEPNPEPTANEQLSKQATSSFESPEPRNPSPAKRSRSRSASKPVPVETPEPRSPLERHSRRCLICRHKDREDIESDFLQWNNSVEITIEYDIPSVNILYRHVHATGIYEQRLKNMRFAAERMVDKVETVKPSANAILRAMRACAQINEHGEWIEPPTRVIHYPGPMAPPLELPAARISSPKLLPAAPDIEESESKGEEKVNQEGFQLKIGANSTKQTTEVTVNQ